MVRWLVKLSNFLNAPYPFANFGRNQFGETVLEQLDREGLCDVSCVDNPLCDGEEGRCANLPGTQNISINDGWAQKMAADGNKILDDWKQRPVNARDIPEHDPDKEYKEFDLCQYRGRIFFHYEMPRCRVRREGKNPDDHPDWQELYSKWGDVNEGNVQGFSVWTKEEVERDYEKRGER